MSEPARYEGRIDDKDHEWWYKGGQRERIPVELVEEVILTRDEPRSRNASIALRTGLTDAQVALIRQRRMFGDVWGRLINEGKIDAASAPLKPSRPKGPKAQRFAGCPRRRPGRRAQRQRILSAAGWRCGRTMNRLPL